jgi:ribosomal protein S18 acetylase RimI-like enzyme
MHIERAATMDDLSAAEGLLDRSLDAAACRRFLADGRHHLLLAYDGNTVVGFASGVEMTHPDKGTELFIYELAVAAGRRRQGIATALLRELALLGRRRGCYGMWVLAEADNDAARSLYSSFGAAGSEAVMFSWSFVS